MGELGFCRVTDNVVRRKEREAHVPGLKVTYHDEPPGYWQAVWPRPGDELPAVATDTDLGGLLDELDRIFGAS